MARTNTNAELWKALSQFGMMTDKSTGATTLRTTVAVAAAAAAATIKLAGKAGGSSASGGDYLRIGSAGVMEVNRIEVTSTNMTLRSKLAYAHAVGEQVWELSRTDLGDLSDDGVQIEVAADRTRIDAATRRHAYDYNINHTEYKVTVALEDLSNENLLAAVGIADSAVHGGGLTTDPTVVDWTPASLNGQNPVHFWARGTKGDGTTIEVQFFDCKLDPTKTMALARGQDAPASLVFNSQHIRWLTPVS